jgi:hypothetical protein
MSHPLLPLTIETIIEDTQNVDTDTDTDIDTDIEYTYDCWINQWYDLEFLLSCAMTMTIFLYIQFIDYIAKKYLH